MWRYLIIWIVAMSLTGGVSAADAPSPKLLQFFEKIGLVEILEKQHAAQVQKAREQFDRGWKQIVQQVPEMSAPEFSSYMSKLKQAMDQANANVAKAYTTREALSVYAQVFDRTYGAELDPAIAAISTPEGERLARTTNEAAVAMIQFESTRIEEAQNREFQGFLVRFRSSVDELRNEIKTKRGSKPQD